MGINFNTEFARLNTNTDGDSANILDAQECQAARYNSVWTVSEGMTAEQFKAANQHCSEYDIDKDGVVTVAEQKASIATELKKVWTSSIARFFKDDINYDDSSENAAAKITKLVKDRIQNALSYIQYAKENNIDIFRDNSDTGVNDENGELQSYTNGNGDSCTTTSATGVRQSKANSDGTYTTTYNNGDTATWNNNSLKLASTWKCGSYNISDSYEYNEDGSYTYHQKLDNGEAFRGAYDKNAQQVGYYKITANGNYKANARADEKIEDTLRRLGITNSADIEAVKEANPKATINGRFSTKPGDVYIPKEVIANMKKNGTFDEARLMSA